MSRSLVRFKGKGLVASCFYACRFPIEEECDQPQKLSAGKIGGSSRARRRKRGGSRRRCSLEPRLSPEDYIVFCFREDGGIDVVNEGRGSSEEAYSAAGKEERVLHMIDEQVKKRASWSASPPIGVEKGGEEKEMKKDSDPSTTNTSFAFPVLETVEWMGSPAQMPRHDNIPSPVSLYK